MINNWKDLPIGKFQQISKICEHSSEDELEQVDDRIKIVSILSDKSVSDLENLPITEFAEIYKQTKFLYEEMPKSDIDFEKGLTINGKDYYIFHDFTKMKTAHYIDFQKLVKTIDNGMALVLSTCIIPKGKEYNRGYDITKVQKQIREHLSVVDANGICFFFAKKFKSSMGTFLTYLEKDKTLSKESREKMKEQVKKAKKVLEQSGDGRTM